jgi:hypothetical protein
MEVALESSSGVVLDFREIQGITIIRALMAQYLYVYRVCMD